MNEIKEFIESGILENYVLGQLNATEEAEVEQQVKRHPEVLSALHAIQDNLNTYIDGLAILPPKNQTLEIRNKIRVSSAIIFNAKNRLEMFVDISEHKTISEWRHVIAALDRPGEFNTHVHELYKDDEKSLAILWVRGTLSEDEHVDIKESVLVVKGSCTGELDDEIVELKPGDYWEIPMRKPHKLIVAPKETVVLIVMRRAA